MGGAVDGDGSGRPRSVSTSSRTSAWAWQSSEVGLLVLRACAAISGACNLQAKSTLVRFLCDLLFAWQDISNVTDCGAVVGRLGMYLL